MWPQSDDNAQIDNPRICDSLAYGYSLLFDEVGKKYSADFTIKDGLLIV